MHVIYQCIYKQKRFLLMTNNIFWKYMSVHAIPRLYRMYSAPVLNGNETAQETENLCVRSIYAHLSLDTHTHIHPDLQSLIAHMQIFTKIHSGHLIRINIHTHNAPESTERDTFQSIAITDNTRGKRNSI